MALGSTCYSWRGGDDDLDHSEVPRRQQDTPGPGPRRVGHRRRAPSVREGVGRCSSDREGGRRAAQLAAPWPPRTFHRRGPVGNRTRRSGRPTLFQCGQCSPREFLRGCSGLGAGRGTGRLSTVARTSFMSWRFAPSTARPTGTPWASVSRLRLTPRLPRSVGLAPEDWRSAEAVTVSLDDVARFIDLLYPLAGA